MPEQNLKKSIKIGESTEARFVWRGREAELAEEMFVPDDAPNLEGRD